MKNATDTLPDDVDALKTIVHELLLSQASESVEKQKMVDRLSRLQTRIETLEKYLRLSRHQRFGASSEKSPDQIELFDDADSVVIETPAVIESTEDESRPDSDGSKKKPVRTRFPADFPRITKTYVLAGQDLVCDCGCQRVEIGEDTSEQLDLIPAQARIVRHVRKKYACKACEGSVRIAERPESFLPKSNATEATLATVITHKYQDAIPLYRLSNILERLDIDVSRQTLSQWILKAAERLEPYADHLDATLTQGDLIQMDETAVQVLRDPKAPDKAPQSKSYMWVRRGGPPDKRVILFHYEPTRSGDVPIKLLRDYRGALMTDGYEGYNAVVRTNGLTHLCCMAHARRKFVEAQKAMPAKTKNGRIDMALSYFAKLYAIERDYTQASPENRFNGRQEKTVQVLAQFREWLDKTQREVVPKGKLGEAVAYTLKYWEKLTRFTENGAWPIDNNATENAIRPFVVGRKNWLFSNTGNGAVASSRLYSIIETAKANGHEPYHYLKWLFTTLPKTPESELEALMPWSVSVETVRGCA